MTTKIAIIDDDPDLCHLLKEVFSGLNFRSNTFLSGESFLSEFEVLDFDLIVLDLNLPSLSGIQVLEKIRDISIISIIILSGQSNLNEKVECFEVGADDFIEKPFFIRELEARTKALLRRSSYAPERFVKYQPIANSQEYNGWHIDLSAGRVTGPEKNVIPLTGRENKILELFLSRPGEVLNRDLIMREIMGRKNDPSDRSLDVTIGKIRNKLNDDPLAPEFIKTIRGGGYCFIAKTTT